MTVATKRTLGLWTLTALVSGNMIGSGIFMLPAALAAYGTISILGWICTSLGALLLALVFARLSRIMPKAGGPYAYCREAYGDFIGFQIAYNYWIALWVGNAAISVALVGYLAVFWPNLDHDPQLALLTSIALVWLITGINIIGVREAGRFQLITTILKIIPLLLIATIGLLFIHKPNLLQFNISTHSNFSALTAAAALTLWSFVGFESATVPAGHAINPERDIPRATILGTLIAAFIYILSTIAIMGIIPVAQLAHSYSPYAAAAHVIFGNWGSIMIAIAASIACAGTLNGWILLQGQVPLAVAQDKLFPKIFAKTSSNGTPVFGLIISSILITILLVLRYGTSLVDQFTFIILLATLASLIPYLYTAIAELMLHIKDSKRLQKKRLVKTSILPIMAFLYAFWAISGVDKEVIFYGMLLFFSALPIYVWLKWRDQP